MAVKTRAQILAVYNAFLPLAEAAKSDRIAHDYLMNLLHDAVVAGDEVDENPIMLAAWAALNAARANLETALLAFMASMHPMLGRYGGSLNLADVQANLAAFHDKVATDSDAFDRRFNAERFTTMSAGGSNVGDGVIMVHTISQANGGDVSHVQTLTLTCKQATPETESGAETFQVTGAALAANPTLEGGTGTSPGYSYKDGFGKAINYPSEQQASGEGQLDGENKLSSVGTATAAGNLLTDGGFENTLTDAWTVAGSNFTRNTTSPIEGTGDLKIAGNDTAYELVGSRLSTLSYYGLNFWALKSGSPTGNLHVKLKDSGSTYLDCTVDVSTLGTSAAAVPYVTCLLPASADIATLQVEISIANFGGSSTPLVFIDKVTLAQLVIVDGGRAIRPIGGVTPWAKNDTFTGVTSAGNDDGLQFYNNRVFGRGFPSAASPTNWGDATLAPEISVDRVADAGTDALGTVAVANQDITYTISNTGNANLYVVTPTTGSDSNCTSSILTALNKAILKPGETATFTVRVTPSGAGAFSCAVSFANNDANENPYNWTLSGTAA